MEKQCRHLYNKLVNTTQRNAALVGRLTSIHQHYGSGNRDNQRKSQSPQRDDFAGTDPIPSTSETVTKAVDSPEQYNPKVRTRMNKSLSNPAELILGSSKFILGWKCWIDDE